MTEQEARELGLDEAMRARSTIDLAPTSGRSRGARATS